MPATYCGYCGSGLEVVATLIQTLDGLKHIRDTRDNGQVIKLISFSLLYWRLYIYTYIRTITIDIPTLTFGNKKKFVPKSKPRLFVFQTNLLSGPLLMEIIKASTSYA